MAAFNEIIVLREDAIINRKGSPSNLDLSNQNYLIGLKVRNSATLSYKQWYTDKCLTPGSLKKVSFVVFSYFCEVLMANFKLPA